MQLAKNSVYSLLGAAIPIAVSLITVPLYVAEIGMERYGALAIAWLLLGYFGQADFGIGRAITQRIAANPGASDQWRARAVSSAFVSIAVFSLIGAALVYGVAAYFFSGPFRVSESLRLELLSSVWVLALCNPIVAISGVASGAFIGLERFKLVSIATLIGNTGLQVLPLIYALYIDCDLGSLVLCALLGRSLGFFILLVSTWLTFFRRSFVRPAWIEIKNLASFGVWIMVTALIGPLMIFADRFMIGAIESAVAVAAYSIPFQIASRTMILPMSVVQVLFPRFASESPKDSQKRCSDYTIFVGQIFAPIIIGLICLSSPLLYLWLGDQLDTRSIIISQLLLASFWINAIANVPYAFIQASGNPRFTAKLHLLELPIYAALLYVLGSSFGLAGFAVAFGLRCAIDFIALALQSGADRLALLKRLAPQISLILLTVIFMNRNYDLAIALVFAVALPILSCGITLRQLPEAISARLLRVPVISVIVRMTKPN